jgi:hypothetical protein
MEPVEEDPRLAAYLSLERQKEEVDLLQGLCSFRHALLGQKLKVLVRALCVVGKMGRSQKVTL